MAKGIPVVGDVLQGAGQIQQGLAANAAGKYTRRVMKQNSRNALNDGVEQADRIRLEARQAMGRQLVGQAGGGFEMGTGSALDALFESQVAREIDLATVRRQSVMKSDAFKQEGDLARAKGRAAMVGGFISGAASFVNAASSAFGAPKGAK